MRKGRFLAFAALLAVAATYPATADLSLDVAPAKYEMQIAPGTAQTIPITVRNTGNAAVHVVASLSDFNVGTDGNYKFLSPGKGRYSMGTWVSVNPREFDLPANTLQQVRFSINVPSHAVGEYSAIVFFSTRPTRRGANGISFSERIASKLYELVPDTLRVAGEIDDVSVKPTGGMEKYLIGFRNTGNVHLYLNGRVEIKRGGQVVDRIVLPKEQLVERSGRRVLEVSGAKLPPGTYTATAIIDYGGPNLTAGQANFSVH